jgi:hypothetical protein
MNSVRPIGQSLATGSGAYRAATDDREVAPKLGSSRALVPLAVRPEPVERIDYGRPAAPFLAQLIATKQNLPQAREYRRAEPCEAIAAYTATARILS